MSRVRSQRRHREARAKLVAEIREICTRQGQNPDEVMQILERNATMGELRTMKAYRLMYEHLTPEVRDDMPDDPDAEMEWVRQRSTDEEFKRYLIHREEFWSAAETEFNRLMRRAARN